MKHVELYVNDWTVNLGETGRQALAELSRRAVEAGLAGGAGNEAPTLEVFEPGC